MSVLRVHHCISQERIAQGTEEPPARKCRCRKFISLQEATRLVKLGEASWVVVGRKRGEEEINCRLCKADPEVKNCARCRGTGKETVPYEDDVYGNDIVYTNPEHHGDAVLKSFGLDSQTESRKIQYATKARIQHFPTIDATHILRAYVSNEARKIVDNVTLRKGLKTCLIGLVGYEVSPASAQYERDRIEEYGLLTLKEREKLLAPFIPDPFEGRTSFISFSVQGIHITEDSSEENYLMMYPHPLRGFPRGVFKQGITNDNSRRFSEVLGDLRVEKPECLQLRLVVPKGGRDLEKEFQKEFSRYRLKSYEAAALGLPNPTEWYCGSAIAVAEEFLKTAVVKYTREYA